MTGMSIAIMLLSWNLIVPAEWNGDRSPDPVLLPNATIALGCNTKCLEGDGTIICPVGQHTADYSLNGYTGGTDHSQCSSHSQGGCGSSTHPYCGGDGFAAGDAEAVLAAIRSGDYRRVQHYLLSAPQQVVLNHSRSALQVVDCVGDVVAHVPLQADQLQRLLAIN